MSTISSSFSSYGMQSMMPPPKKPDASEMASELFSKLDTSNKGYIEESDLSSALSQLSSSTDSTSSTDSSSSASQLFSKLDSDGDGKVTQDEMTSGLKKLQDELESQFNQMRMEGGMSDMAGMQGMPPPPPENDTGFSKDELQSQLDEIGSTDSKRSSLISNIVANFDQADSDGDGKVTMQEAMAYDQSSSSSSSTSTVSSTSSSSDSSSSSSSSSTLTDAQLFKQIMDLMRTYGQSDASQSASAYNTLSSLLSVSA